MELKFSQNWNNKLNCSYFTTIRVASAQHVPGAAVEVFLKGETKGIATIVKVEGPGTFAQIPEGRIMLDTGYPKPDAEKVFRNFYPNLDSLRFNIITLKWQK